MTIVAEPVAPARPRDRMIDLLRAISIVRVVIIHIMRQAVLPLWPAPTYIMPGMPVIFFVSGSLAFQSLRSDARTRRTAMEYWKRTYRRLLVPFWAFYATMVAIAVVGDIVSDTEPWTIRWPSLIWGFSALAVPKPSPAVSNYIGHLWFMSVFMVLALLAPLLVRLFEHFRWAVPATVAAIFCVTQTLEMAAGWYVPQELDALSMFAVMYVCGFLYNDGTLTRASVAVLLSVGAAAAVGAVIFDPIDPGSVNRSEPKHLLVGAAWLFVGLAAAPPLRRFADRHRAGLDRITRRTFTAYLWGWPTCRFAAQRANAVFGRGWDYRGAMAAGSLALLALAIALYGWFEDRSAGRAPRRVSSPNTVSLP